MSRSNPRDTDFIRVSRGLAIWLYDQQSALERALGRRVMMREVTGALASALQGRVLEIPDAKVLDITSKMESSE